MRASITLDGAIYKGYNWYENLTVAADEEDRIEFKSEGKTLTIERAALPHLISFLKNEYDRGI